MSVINGPKIPIMAVAAQGDNYFTQGGTLLRSLQALMQPNVINMTTSVPPGSPADGDTYIVASSPSGLWAGQANAIAYWSLQNPAAPSGEWEFYTPVSGWIVGNHADGHAYIFNGTTWLTIASSGTGFLSIAQTSAPATVNLTTEGTNDWFITSGVNVSGQQPSQSSFYWKKNGGGFVQNTFVFYYTLSADAPAASSNTINGPVAFTATAGDAAYPAGSTSVSPPPTAFSPYIEISASPTAGGGYGYQFSVLSNSISRTLRLYMTVQGILNPMSATVTAHLMDGSVSDQSVTVTDAVTGGIGTGYEITIVFKSASPCPLLVTVELTGVHVGAVSFLGATIA